MQIEADLVVFNGNIFTMDPQKPHATALAVKSYKVLAIGNEEDVIDLVPNAARVIDLAGKTVVPGFIDAHTHLTSAGIKESHIHLEDAESAEEVLQIVRDNLDNYQKGEWVLGYSWDESQWPEKRYIKGKYRTKVKVHKGKVVVAISSASTSRLLLLLTSSSPS